MTNPINVTLSHSLLDHVINRILASGKITSADQNFLLRVMLVDQPLSFSEQNQLKLVFDRLQMGLLHVVD